MRSIRRRLLLWLLSGIGLLLIVAAAGVYLEIRDEINELFDAQLQQSAYAFPRGAVAPAEIGDVDDNGGDSPLQNLVVEVRQPGVAKPFYHSQAHAVLPAHVHPGFSNPVINGQVWRLYSLEARDRHVEVAQPLAVRDAAANQIAKQLLLPLAAALPFAALLIWFGVGRGLKPLRQTARDIQQRSDADLTALDTTALPGELRPMVTALNELMKRLVQVLQGQRYFIADAAHELLTPLTALQLQAQWLQRSSDVHEREQGLLELRAGIERTVRLARQLLALARQESKSGAVVAEINLTALAREVVAEQAGTAAARQIDLGFDGAMPLQIRGEVEALRMMLSNLVDNAIKYTPVAGRVDVRVARLDGAGLLRVEDSGPGIPVEDLQRVFDRFYRRAGQTVAGSGLGLAIVRNIAERQGVSLNLSNGGALGGLVVECRWPIAAVVG